MKITIDEKVCLKHKMTLQEFLIALAVRAGGFEECMENLVAREILVNNSLCQVTQHWSDVIDEIICDSSDKGIDDEERLLNLAKKMRELYPLGKMKDRYGRETPYYYRCNNTEIVKALKRFFLVVGKDIPDEDILNATKRYVASFNGNYSGMRLIKYFILKNDVKPGEDGQGHVEQISDLLTFLENKESEGDAVASTSDDWLMNSRN